ncbi:MAG: SDR family oxidoreductase [Acidimicrobiales bacterium]|nr:SDR family oxidoreductase [Acidimicrobiales bacterium]
MGTLDGRSVVVTGASSGIGEAVARRLVAEGALVTIGSRSEPVVAGATWVPTDVADPSAADALIDAAVDANGGLNVLVNNAGVQVVRTLADTTDGEFDHVMDVNVRGVFNCCRAAIRWMSDNGGGSIINVGSVAADAADHSMAVYNASKGAVHSLTRSIAIDHGRDGVRCNAICPGWIATAMAEVAFEQSDDPTAARAGAVDRHPVGRLGSPEDVANLAAWLASDEATFVSGSLFTIDGGLTAQSPIGG